MTGNFFATLESATHRERGSLELATMESIAFQLNDSFGKDLETVVQKYKDLVDSGVNQKVIKAAKPLHEELQKVIFKRLGIQVSLDTDSYIAATMPNTYIPHNPMIQDNIRWIFEDFQEIGAQDKLKKLKTGDSLGTVNAQTAKVTGWFSEQKVPLFINFKKLFKDFKMTVPEVTAIILHELGHDFEGIFYSANINTTNQVLAEVARHISDSDRGGDVKYIYNRLRAVNPAMTMDIAEGLSSKNRVVMNMALYRLVVGTTNSLMSNHVYDRTNFESTADQFASRFGYANALVSSLEKLEKYGGSEYQQSQEIFKGSIILMTLFGFWFILGAAMVFSLPGIGLVLGPLAMYICGIVIYAAYGTQRASQKDMTYDNIRDRYLRLRSQLVEFIKNQDLDRSVRERTLKQITDIDLIISEKKVFVSFLEKFNNKFFPSDRRAVIGIEFQQESERMIANDLFISASKLAIA